MHVRWLEVLFKTGRTDFCEIISCYCLQNKFGFSLTDDQLSRGTPSWWITLTDVIGPRESKTVNKWKIKDFLTPSEILYELHKVNIKEEELAVNSEGQEQTAVSYDLNKPKLYLYIYSNLIGSFFFIAHKLCANLEYEKFQKISSEYRQGRQVVRHKLASGLIHSDESLNK